MSKLPVLFALFSPLAFADVNMTFVDAAHQIRESKFALQTGHRAADLAGLIWEG